MIKPTELQWKVLGDAIASSRINDVATLADRFIHIREEDYRDNPALWIVGLYQTFMVGLQELTKEDG